MTIIKVFGRQGNQMFQYAFAYAYTQQNKQSVKLDTTDFKNDSLRTYKLGFFKINMPLATEKEANELHYKKRNIFVRALRKPKKWGFADTCYPEPHFHFDKKTLEVKDDVYFEGYWQSEKYFKKYRNELLKQFTLKAKNSLKNQTISAENYSNRINKFTYSPW